MDRYEPPSAFLKSLIDDDAPLTGADAQSNLGRLMALMRDEHPANRDWATLLLAQQDIDATDVREALLAAADSSLVDDLRDFVVPSDDALLDELATKALKACEAAA